MSVLIHRTPDDLIHVSAGYGVSITPDAADALGLELSNLAREIRQDAARAICATEGHQWWGSNAYRHGDLDDLIHIRYCMREHCEAREESDGWQDTVYPGSIEEQIDNAIRDCAISAEPGMCQYPPRRPARESEPEEPAVELAPPGILRVERECPGAWWHRFRRSGS